ncbi:MAG: hypothetical protein PVG59_15610 [Desulfobacterales bacterium]|jgi:hypothetical protein
MAVELRKYARYLPKENAFAALGREYTRVGKIKNIALGGLAFEYIVGEALNEDATEADIFLVGNVFHLHNIPCRIIYDIEVHVPYVNNSYVKLLTTKRCGLAFGKLNDDKLLQLKFFIQAYTAGGRFP